ncbi:MAG: YlmC/YmxH family sporulation protein [Clostridia bacterium]
MRLSEIGNKEIVDLSTGCSHGQLWDAEMIFDKKTGKIRSYWCRPSKAAAFRENLGDMCELPWSSIVIME